MVVLGGGGGVSYERDTPVLSPLASVHLDAVTRQAASQRESLPAGHSKFTGVPRPPKTAPPSRTTLGP